MRYLILLIYSGTSLFTAEYSSDHKAYPNPCDRNKCCFEVNIKPNYRDGEFAEGEQVRLEVFDYNMILIYRRDYVVEKEQSVVWSRVDQRGKRVPTGLYLISVTGIHNGSIKKSSLRVIVK